MKKYLILLLVAAALVSCGKGILEPENGDETVQSTPVTFNLTANHPDATKAVKGGWEAGDAIFVFFTGAAAPRHLKMTYDGSSWTSVEFNGAVRTSGALGLKNDDTGTMRAVFLPFGSGATVSASGKSFTFGTKYYAYYLTATLPYTVTDNEVSGAFNMEIPDGYVQFFIEDADATDGAYTLGCDAVIPTGVASVASDGTVKETTNKTASDDMPGYAYSGGYLFSGRLNGSYAYSGNYYFAKTKASDNSRADYFVGGKTLASHSAVKLPANDDIYAVESGVPNDGKWVPVGRDITVELYKSDLTTSLGKWHTCNCGGSVPESLGTLYSFEDANALDVKLPTKEQFEIIDNSGNCSYVWMVVHGLEGAVFKADRGFLFLPSQNSGIGHYWSSTEYDVISNHVWLLFFRSSQHYVGHIDSGSGYYPVRPIEN